MIFNNVLGKKAAKLQSKSVTYTSNGTASVTPDSGYDGLSKVDVTVNVSGSTAVEKCTISLTHSGTSTPIAYLYQYVSGSMIVIGFGNLAKNASVTLSNVVCGSLLAIVTKFEEALDYSSNITDEQYITYNNSAISLTGVITPKEADATGTITVITTE